MDTFLLNFKEFYLTFNLVKFYEFKDQVDILSIILNWKVLSFGVIIIGLLFSPIKTWVAGFLFYVIFIGVFFFILIIIKNSDLTPKEHFIFLAGSISLISSYCIYNYLLK